MTLLKTLLRQLDLIKQIHNDLRKFIFFLILNYIIITNTTLGIMTRAVDIMKSVNLDIMKSVNLDIIDEFNSASTTLNNVLTELYTAQRINICMKNAHNLLRSIRIKSKLRPLNASGFMSIYKVDLPQLHQVINKLHECAYSLVQFDKLPKHCIDMANIIVDIITSINDEIYRMSLEQREGECTGGPSASYEASMMDYTNILGVPITRLNLPDVITQIVQTNSLRIAAMSRHTSNAFNYKAVYRVINLYGAHIRQLCSVARGVVDGCLLKKTEAELNKNSALNMLLMSGLLLSDHATTFIDPGKPLEIKEQLQIPTKVIGYFIPIINVNIELEWNIVAAINTSLLLYGDKINDGSFKWGEFVTDKMESIIAMIKS